MQYIGIVQTILHESRMKYAKELESKLTDPLISIATGGFRLFGPFSWVERLSSSLSSCTVAG